MNLPNYFLADLPPEATLSATMIGEACQTLKRNRERYLAHRTTHSLVKVLSDVARSWLEPDYPFRKLALEQSPAGTGFSPATLASGLDCFFKQLTPESFHALLEQDLGHAHRLDKIVASHTEQKADRGAIALGPELLVHISAGNLPAPTLMSMVLGVLVRSAQFVKCASGAALVPRLFAHSLYEVEPKLGACLEIAEWRGEHHALTDALFNEADCVTATGTDDTLEAVRARVPAKARFIGYGHRVSFGFVTNRVLAGLNARKVGRAGGGRRGRLEPIGLPVAARDLCGGRRRAFGRAVCGGAGGGTGAAGSGGAAGRTAGGSSRGHSVAPVPL